MHRVLLVAVAVLLSSSRGASAGGLLDYFREYDLNDYALGLGISVGENPYSGTDAGTYAYPYLTSFRDSAFTRDWLLVRDGEVGIRRVTDSDWEFGVIGRVQALGSGPERSEQLEGIDSRKWTVEAGPTVSWRGWPVHFTLSLYDEIGGRHGGQVGELAASLPREWSRGYVVPAVAAVRQSDEYTQYYFGISPDEAGGLRAPYSADGALNAEARLRWGYALSDRWLLSGSLGVEFLGHQASDSPIVERDSLWSASLRLAWNADVFQPRTPAPGAESSPAVELSVGAFQTSIDTSFVNRSGDGRPGSRVDVEDALNASDSETVSRVDALWRPARYHRLEAGYYRFSRDGARVLDNTLLVGDLEFPAGTLVSSRSESEVWRVAYGYSLIRDAQKEFGVMAGLHLTSIDVEIGIPDEGRRQASSADTPLPVIGAFGSVPIGERTVVGAKASFFLLDFDRYNGSLAVLTADVRRYWGQRFSVGLAWHFSNLNIDVEGDRLRGSLMVRHSGPALFVTAGF